MKNKTKYFKNPDRDIPKPFQPYIPQWQLLGKEPTGMTAGKVPTVSTQTQLTKHAPFISYLNPKVRPVPAIGQNVPFAETGSATIGHAPLPNVGNNVENTWAGIDGMLVDDVGDQVKIDINQPMIDNNDDDLNNYLHIPKVLGSAPAPQMQEVENQEEEDDLATHLEVALRHPEGESVLVVRGEIISVGTTASIQEEVRSLIFEEHPLSKDNNITIDDIVVLKRVKIKVGVFLE